MENRIKSKTRLAAIQLVFQHLINNEDIDSIKEDFNIHFKNVKLDKSSGKIKYNNNFLSKLISYFKESQKDFRLTKEINNLLKFNRKFEKWDSINKAIMLVAISELKNSKSLKNKIILNDYLEISKLFVNSQDTKVINALLDKFINE